MMYWIAEPFVAVSDPLFRQPPLLRKKKATIKFDFRKRSRRGFADYEWELKRQRGGGLAGKHRVQNLENILLNASEDESL